MKRLDRTGRLTILILLAILVLSFSLTYYFFFSSAKVIRNSPISDALSTAEGKRSFTDVEGNPVKLTDEFGKIIIVFSWASWCPECAADLPALNKLAEEYPNELVKVIAVNRAENLTTAQRFLQTLGDLNNIEIVLDPDDTFFDALDGYAMPETIMYDTKGEVVLHQRGSTNPDELRTVISELE